MQNTCSKKWLWLAAALCAPGLAFSQSVKVENAWARATVAGQAAGGAFATLTSSSKAAVVAASSTVSDSVEIHEMAMESGVMKMRALPRLDLPKGVAVELKPGGHHLMLLGLKRPLNVGEVVPITLKIESEDKKTSEVTVNATVRPAIARSGHHH